MPRRQFGDVGGEDKQPGDYAHDSRPFTARYDGWCSGDCGGPICAGEEVSYVDDELMHVDCVPRYRPERREPTKCIDCNMFHVGECP